MRLIFLLSLLMLQPSFSSYGQTIETSQSQDDLTLQKISLISDLQALEAKAGQLEKPLARASAKAEIADAAWTLDKDWAEKLLREAYQLTFPSEEVQVRLRQAPVGALILPTTMDTARWVVRQRVMSIASRDASFAGELVQLGVEHLGRKEGHERYAELANSAAVHGDLNEAARYVRQAFEAEPTQMGTLRPIIEIASQDRAAADKLIIQYIEHINSVPISFKARSSAGVLLLLSMLAHPSPGYIESRGRQIAPPGPAAMHAYVGFMLDYIAEGEQRQPGSLQRSRELLLALWPELKKYAPDLIGRFREMEMLSRRPGDKASWPPPDNRERFRKQREELTKSLIESGEADPGVIGLLIDRGEIAGARKLLDKLADGPQKTDLVNKLDAKEAVALVKKGDIAGAQMFVGRLTKAMYILQAYPVVIEKCLSNKDKPCAANMVSQAIRQLKQADVTPPVLPPGVPASVLATGKEFDPILTSLCKLTQLILPADDALASEALNEMVAAANASEVDTGLGRVGFDAEVFRKIAQKDEMRARQSALSFKDPLRQIVSLAAIYRWKAEELDARAIAAPPKSAAPMAAR